MRRVLLLWVTLFAACDGGAKDVDAGADVADVSPDVAATDMVVGDTPGQGADAVDVMVWTTCPPNQPSFSGGTACQGSVHCGYGNECCCGKCNDSVICDCNNGHFGCFASDACMGSMCSPGCNFNQYTTPTGCQSCDAIKAELPVAMAAALTPIDACTADAECVTLPMPAVCNQGCSIALPAAQTGTGKEILGKMGKDWCGIGYGPVFGCSVACVQSGKPACVQGHCKLVGP